MLFQLSSTNGRNKPKYPAYPIATLNCIGISGAAGYGGTATNDLRGFEKGVLVEGDKIYRSPWGLPKIPPPHETPSHFQQSAVAGPLSSWAPSFVAPFALTSETYLFNTTQSQHVLRIFTLRIAWNWVPTHLQSTHVSSNDNLCWWKRQHLEAL